MWTQILDQQDSINLGVINRLMLLHVYENCFPYIHLEIVNINVSKQQDNGSILCQQWTSINILMYVVTSHRMPY